MTLLTICIPTYKRPNTLLHCINIAKQQIIQFQLENQVNIYVANDASPDNTKDILSQYHDLTFFQSINRDSNIGMSANIKKMLYEASQFSSYQLIITDDDFLQANILGGLVSFLVKQQSLHPDISLIWTPRYSYTEDNQLLCIACNPFKSDTVITSSPKNAGKYMKNGFVLSGLILKSKTIDFDFWKTYLDNAFFPVIFSGELLLRTDALYWQRNIVHHTVLNECHWQRWGENEAEINIRLFIDIVNSYKVLMAKIPLPSQRFIYISASVTSILGSSIQLMSNKSFTHLNQDNHISLLNNQSIAFTKIKSPFSKIVIVGFLISIPANYLRLTLFKTLSFLKIKTKRTITYDEKALLIKEALNNTKFIIQWVKAS